jgi:hypothetical protein
VALRVLMMSFFIMRSSAFIVSKEVTVFILVYGLDCVLFMVVLMSLICLYKSSNSPFRGGTDVALDLEKSPSNTAFSMLLILLLTRENAS